MHIYIYTQIHIFMYALSHARIPTHLRTHMLMAYTSVLDVWRKNCVYIHSLPAAAHASLYIHVHIYMYINIYTRIHAYMDIHI